MHAHTLANMSPRCSLRCVALSVAVILAVVRIEVSAFAIRSSWNTSRIPALAPLLDLAVDESLQLEVRHDFKRPNDLNTNISNKSNEVLASTTDSPDSDSASTSTSNQMPSTMKYNPDVFTEIIRNDTTTKINIIESSVLNTTMNFETNVTTNMPFVSEALIFPENYTTHSYLEWSGATQQPTDSDDSVSLSVESINARALNDTFGDFSAALNDTVEQLAALDRLETKPIQSANTLADKDSSVAGVNGSDYDYITNNVTSRRKYTVIDRITKNGRNETIASPDKYDNKAESLVSLSEATSEEVLRRVATEYSPATTPVPRLDVAPVTTDFPDILVTLQIENITNTFEVSIQKPKFESVSSKRAGFLNYSSKSKQKEATTEYITTESAYRDHTTLALENTFEAFTGRAVAGVPKSQSYLNEDAIREEMLQETSRTNNEEMAEQNREGRVNNTDTTFSFLEQFSILTSTQDPDGTVQTDTENVMSTKPSQDKGKSTAVYNTVSPNYKPMKKLEILPPKQFVRDPDDNSWRNESISSLGIVFKPKNSSKPFTQVLKNKTETEWSNLLNRDSKSDVPDLRERLEKIAQKRKSKKKKTDIFGNVIYSDYEETNSSEEVNSTRFSDIISTVQTISEDTTVLNVLVETVKELSTQTLTSTTTSSTAAPTTVSAAHVATETLTNINSTATTAQLKISSKAPSRTKEISSKKGKTKFSETDKGQKYFNVFDYYDISNEDESDYMQLAKLELKKYSVPTHVTHRPFVTTPPVPYLLTKPQTMSTPERKATIQYFPPRINTQQTQPNRVDGSVKTKIKSHTKISSPKEVTSFSLTNAPNPKLGKYSSRYQQEPRHEPPTHSIPPPLESPHKYDVSEYSRYLSHTDHPRIPVEQRTRFRANEHTDGFHRASFVMKNYKDFIEQAAKDYDYERDAGLMMYTPPPAPVRGVTIGDLLAQEKDRPNVNLNEDYDAKFRKDVLQRFVDNFNHNDARYHGNYPVLYNSTVRHAAGGGDAAAASRAFLKGLYSPVRARSGYAQREPYDPACDNVTVELSPAYELHYYVPEQEEREEIESKPLS